MEKATVMAELFFISILTNNTSCALNIQCEIHGFI